LLAPQTVGVIIGNLERDGAIKKTPHPLHGRVLPGAGRAKLPQICTGTVDVPADLALPGQARRG
jgi:hypothetical protein